MFPHQLDHSANPSRMPTQGAASCATSFEACWINVVGLPFAGRFKHTNVSLGKIVLYKLKKSSLNMMCLIQHFIGLYNLKLAVF